MTVADGFDPTDPGPAGPRVANDELASRRAARTPPPHDLDAERALLGAALLDIEATDTGGLRPDDFYKPAHAHIYAAIQTLDDAGHPVDPITVADQLRHDGLYDTIGGHETLLDIMATGTAPTGAPRYAAIIRDCARLRRIMGFAAEAALAAQARDLGTALHHLETALDTPDQTDAQPIGARLGDHLDLLERRVTGDIPVLATGLTDLDRVIDGFRPGELYVAGGRPGMGKTAFAGQIALNAAQAGHRTLFVSIEMSGVELTDRWLANLSGVDMGRLHRGQLDQPHWQQIAQAVAQLDALPIDVLDAPTVNLPAIRAAARATAARLVVIDYLQLVQATGRTNNRQEEVAEVARGAKNLARALDIPVLALAQLHRGVETRVEKRPTLADFRESGEIENSAGIVIGLYRHEYYHPGSTQHRGELEAVVLKNRHGTTETARLAFRGPWQQIRNLDMHRSP